MDKPPLEKTTRRTVRIGAKLRERRRVLNMTLEALASAAGLTKGFVSEVERDLTSPSVATLLSMCSVLAISIGSLFETAETALVRKADRKRIDFGGTDISDFLLSPSTKSRLQMIWSELEPGGSGGEELYSLQAEEEIVLVLEGRVCVNVNGSEIVLEAGDALTFDPRLPHTFANASDLERAVALFTFTPASY